MTSAFRTLTTLIVCLVIIDIVFFVFSVIISSKRWSIVGHLVIEIVAILVYIIIIGLTDMIDNKPIIWALATICFQIYFIWGRISIIRFGDTT